MKTALITGATTGIGLELAKLFAKNKFNLVIVSRNASRLKDVSESLSNEYKVTVKSISKDLSKNNAAREIYEEITNEKLKIDMLVNNAGFGVHGAFSDTDLNEDIEMIQLNITSLVVLTKLFLNDMKKNNSGKIMNVASTAAFQPGPFMAIYYATKSFVLSFSEALGEELSETNITISAFCPGPTKTEFQDRAGINKIKLVSRNLFPMMSAGDAAKIGFEGMMKGNRIVIPGFMNNMLPVTLRFVPRSIVSKISKYIHKE